MPPAITGKPLSTTTAGSTRKRHIMLTPQAVTPSTPEITPKKREKLTPRNTARSNLPEEQRYEHALGFAGPPVPRAAVPGASLVKGLGTEK
jgi:hypothetical protein